MLPSQVTDPNSGMDASVAPLQALYEYKSRPRRDTCIGITYAVLLAAVFVGGFVAFGKADKDFSSYSPDFYAHSSSCDIHTFHAKYIPPPQNVTSDPTDDSFTAAFTKAALVWVPITAVFGVVLSAVFLLLFRRFAMQMVYVTVWFSLAWSIALAVVCFASGAVPMGIVMIIVTLVTAAIYWWARHDLKVCAKLLSVAGQGLSEVPAIIPTAIIVKVIGVGILLYLFAAFVFALFNGTPVQASGVTRTGTEENMTCANIIDGTIVDCCNWSVKPWAAAYAFFNWVCISWTAFVLLQFKLYVVADSIAQWYFLPAGNYAPEQHPSVRRAVKNGLTSSWGSICFAGLVLAVIDFIKSQMEHAARNQDNAVARLLCCILNCILQPLLSMLEKFTRFTTIATAITGQSFVASAKQVFEVLKRNFLRTISLWWVPDAVLGSAVVLFSLGWSCITFFATVAQVRNADNKWGVAFLVAFVCFLCCAFLLQFVAGLLLDIVNTVYICFSLDRDSKRVTKPEIHTIYTSVPTIAGALVENPDGCYAYGAPDAPAQATYAGQPYAAPSQPLMAQQPYPPSYQQQGAYPGAYPNIGAAGTQPGYPAIYGSNNNV